MLLKSGSESFPPKFQEVQINLPPTFQSTNIEESLKLLLMVQKSGVHQLSLVVHLIIYDGFHTSQVVGNGISSIKTVPPTRLWSYLMAGLY